MDIFIEDLNLRKGIEQISRFFPVNLSEDGIKVYGHKTGGDLTVSLKNGICNIYYKETAHFYRGLGHLIENGEKIEFNITESPQFDTSGAMIDLSRNAVLTLDSIEKTLCTMALMGHNFVLLYTENTYEVDNHPYFGYMRGRYSKEELKAMDDFAFELGIELVPCIQTLGHLALVLRWEKYWEYKDTENVLLTDDEKVYKFIEEMLTSAMEPFRTKRIHLGMDEAHDLGLGRHLLKNGYSPKSELMERHLKRVNDICKKMNLKPMIWSDMYFRSLSKYDQYYDYDVKFTQDVIDSVPKDVQLVYWDYYHDKKEEYEYFAKQHEILSNNTFFAGGFWSFAGNLPKFLKTEVTSIPALEVCKERNIREICICTWQDNGAETNFFYAHFGLALYAEAAFSKEFDKEKFKKRLEFFTGISYESYMEIDRLSGSPTDFENPQNHTNPSKYILYQDILTGLFDANIKGCNHKNQYLELYRTLSKKPLNTENEKLLIPYATALAKVLWEKCEIGIEIKEAYDKSYKADLYSFANVKLKELYNDVTILREEHRKQWYKTCKPFGFEVIDIRYGGLLARIDTAIYRLNDYIKKGTKIDELSEERLYFSAPINQQICNATSVNTYSKIVTAGSLG